MANFNQRRINANYVGNKGILRIDAKPNLTDDRETPKALATTGPIAKSTANNSKRPILRYIQMSKMIHLCICLLNAEKLLANGHHIQIIVTADLKIRTDKMHTTKTYLLPMILGINYLMSKHVSIIFKDFPSGNNYKIKPDRRLLIDANSELVIWGQLPRYLSVGLQGVCVNNKFLLCNELLLANTLVTIPINHVVPLKILNPTDEVVSIPKGSMLSDFHLLNKDYDIIM